MTEKWIEAAGKFLDVSINKMGELAAKAENVSDLKYITEAVEKVGNLKLGAKVLDDSSDPEVGDSEEETATEES